MDNSIRLKCIGYHKLNSFIHVVEKQQDGSIRSYHGHIQEIYEDILVLRDWIAGDVVIVFETITIVEPSDKEEKGNERS